MRARYRRIYRPSEDGVEMLKNGRRRVEEQKRVLDEMITFNNEHFREESNP